MARLYEPILFYARQYQYFVALASSTDKFDEPTKMQSTLYLYPMHLRKLLIQLVLLSLLFNAVIVTPLHAASHLPHAEHGVALVADEDSHSANEHPAVDGVCTWCLSASLQPFECGGDCASLMFDLVAYPAQHHDLSVRAVFKAAPDHWPFASRDPPRG